MRASECGVDDILAGSEFDDGARVAMGARELALAVGLAVLLKYAPHQSLVDVLAVGRELGDQADLCDLAVLA